MPNTSANLTPLLGGNGVLPSTNKATLDLPMLLAAHIQAKQISSRSRATSLVITRLCNPITNFGLCVGLPVAFLMWVVYEMGEYTL
jgi:hypothetical protein